MHNSGSSAQGQRLPAASFWLTAFSYQPSASPSLKHELRAGNLLLPFGGIYEGTLCPIEGKYDMTMVTKAFPI
jgi:hypothetical protein